MCTYCSTAAINTRNIFKRFGLTFLPPTPSPLQLSPAPEITTDTCMSENVVHYNLNIRVMAYDTDFYYNARLSKR